VPASRVIAPTTFSDSASPTSGSLRAAIIAANNDSASGTITIQLAAGTYSLTVQNTAGQEDGAQQGDLDITNPVHMLILVGQGTTGANATVIDTGGLNDRAFQVDSGVTVQFQNLVIEHGLAQDNGTAGAAPGSTDGLGGGILNQGGNVSLTNVVLQGNEALGGTGHNGLGGGLYTSAGTVRVAQSTFFGNVALGGSGLPGVLTSQGLVGGPGGTGGAGQGAGLYAAGGSVTLVGDTVSSNTALGGAGGRGGFGSRGGPGGQGGTGAGAAVADNGALLALVGDTLSSNLARGGQGGPAGSGTLFAGSTGRGGSGLGGGLYTGGGFANLVNDTFVLNTTQAGSGSGRTPVTQGGAIDAAAGIVLLTNDTLTSNASGQGGGVENAAAFVSLQNTLVAQNTATTGPDFAGAVQVSDHNLIGNSSGSTGFSAANGDILNPSSVGLGSLANNGGPTQTLALLTGNPAIDAGDDAALGTIAQAEGVAVANATDQTGQARLYGAHLDIGAFEVQPRAMTLQLVVPTFTAGQPDTVQVKVLDQYGNLLTSDNSDQVTLSGVAFASGSTTATAQKGIATFSNLVINTAGSYTLSASSGYLTQAQSSLTVVPGPSHLVVGGLWQASSAPGQTILEGQNLTFSGSNTVALPNFLLNDASSLTVNVSFQTTASGVILGFQNRPVGSTPTDYFPALYVGINGLLYGEIWNNSLNPIHSVAKVTDGKMHTAVLTVSGTTQTLTLDNTVIGTLTGAVQPLDMVYGQLGTGDTAVWPAGNGGYAPFVGTLDTVAISTGTATTGSAVSSTAGVPATITVAAEDALGNITPGYVGTVHFTSSDPRAVLPADATLTNGIGTFTATLDTAGTQSITATDTNTTMISGSETGITISPAATSQLAVSGFPTSTTAGVAHTVTVTAEDAFGNLTTGYTGTVHLSSSDSKAVLPANATLTNGVGSFSVKLKTAGTQSITATDTATTSITGSETGITVSPAAASQLVLSGFTSSTKAGVACTVTVTAKDAFGNVATGYKGTVHFTSSDPKAVLPANCTLTKGVGSFSVTLETAGTQSVTATDTATATLTGSKTGITVTPAAPASVVFLTQPSNVAAGQAIAPAVQVEILDAFGNVVTTCTAAVKVALANNPGGATLGGTTTVNAVSGVATFNNLTLNVAGTGYTLKASSGTLTKATSTAFNVTAAAPAPAGVDKNGQPGNAVVGQPVTPANTVVVVDADGNTVTRSDRAVTLSVNSDPAGARLGSTNTLHAVDSMAAFSDLTIAQEFLLHGHHRDWDDVNSGFDVPEGI
jgi:hypothetical protein